MNLCPLYLTLPFDFIYTAIIISTNLKLHSFLHKKWGPRGKKQLLATCASSVDQFSSLIRKLSGCRSPKIGWSSKNLVHSQIWISAPAWVFLLSSSSSFTYTDIGCGLLCGFVSFMLYSCLSCIQIYALWSCWRDQTNSLYPNNWKSTSSDFKHGSAMSASQWRL